MSGTTEGNTTHGHSGSVKYGRPQSPTYVTWHAMKQRCNDPKNQGYHKYGGVGIRLCERWHTFANFLADMGERPMGHTIDRIDNSGNYEPSNCRWATPSNQCRNRRGWANPNGRYAREGKAKCSK